MPIYEYKCQKCGHKFEKLRRMSSSDDDVVCPECGAKVERMLSLFAAHSKDKAGITSAVAGAGPSCSGCASSSCATCH